jgi:hypothetical protein
VTKKPTYEELEQRIALLEMELNHVGKQRYGPFISHGHMPPDAASAFLYALINNTRNEIGRAHV